MVSKLKTHVARSGPMEQKGLRYQRTIAMTMILSVDIFVFFVYLITNDLFSIRLACYSSAFFLDPFDSNILEKNFGLFNMQSFRFGSLLLVFAWYLNIDAFLDPCDSNILEYF